MPNIVKPKRMFGGGSNILCEYCRKPYPFSPCDACSIRMREEPDRCIECMGPNPTYLGKRCEDCYEQTDKENGQYIQYVCCYDCGECTPILKCCKWCGFLNQSAEGHIHCGPCWAGCA